MAGPMGSFVALPYERQDLQAELHVRAQALYATLSLYLGLHPYIPKHIRLAVKKAIR